MELEASIEQLARTMREHREVLATEEAAKTALVMPFLQALGYNVFNPAEVVPEFTCDVGTKKGEKVDYAICEGGAVKMLIECKPAGVALNLNHASQLFRYFTVTEARVAILTNGVVYKFYSDIVASNKMDEVPFFEFTLERVGKSDVRTLEKFTKQAFDIEAIVREAGNLKLQSQVDAELAREFADPSDALVRLIASKIHEGNLTPQVRETFKGHITRSINSLIRDKVNERLNSALSASNPHEDEPASPVDEASDIVTTEEELAGMNIVRAIVARKIDPRRVVMRDAKSYCALLLDDNNRKPIVRLHFNSEKVRYVGTFIDKDETKHQVQDATDIYRFEEAILARIDALESAKG